MQNDIIRTAHKFINKTLKGKTDVNAIIAYIGSKGYQINMYDNDEEKELIAKYELGKKVIISHAFTVDIEDTKAVFINNSLSSEGKKYAILHEASHIALGHLDNKDVIKSERLIEMQAEAFAYQLLTYKNSYFKNIKKFILMCLISAGIIAGFNYLPKSLPASDSNIVYVTPSGAKYHNKNCYYIKGHKVTKITLNEAKKTHKPCLICNP